MPTPAILGYDSTSRLHIREHPDTRCVSIDIPPLGLAGFFNVKTRSRLVILLTWCACCALLPIGAAAWFARTHPAVRVVLYMGPVALGFALLIMGLIYAVIARTHTYLRVSPAELTIITRGPGDDLHLHLGAAAIGSISVERPQSDMSFFLVIRQAGADPLYLLQKYPKPELDRICALLNRTVTVRSN